MDPSQNHSIFSPIAEWIIRLAPVVISLAAFIFTMITRYENRKKLIIRWSSTLLCLTPLSAGDPSLIIGIHNTGKRNISLVEDSYYFFANEQEYYIKELDPRVLDRVDYPGLLNDGG